MGNATCYDKRRTPNGELGAGFASGRSSWSDFRIVNCRDEKARRIEPGIEPLVNGIPDCVVCGGNSCASCAANTSEARVMRLKGYGNAIVPPVAAEFIRACFEEMR